MMSRLLCMAAREMVGAGAAGVDRSSDADRIYGDEFEYDQNAGVVRAIGIVHIDLQAQDAAVSVPGKAKTSSQPRILHATTSGLVFLQKLGIAATKEYIEFQLGEMTGHATGADYNTDSGMLVLQSAVNVSGLSGGRPVVLTASRAQIDQKAQGFAARAGEVCVAGGRRCRREHAILHTRPDGSVERIEAEGRVTASSDGATVTAQRADATVTVASKPELVKLTGDVQYVADEPLRQARAQAQAGTITFDALGQPAHGTFTRRSPLGGARASDGRLA